MLFQLSESYQKVYEAVSVDLVKDYVPPPWIALVQVKREYYKASAHHFIGNGLHQHQGPLSKRTKETFSFLYAENNTKSSKLNTIIDVRVPKDENERIQLGERGETC